MFGAIPGELGANLIGNIPGVIFIRWTAHAEPSAPTKGRALDHIGFEVKGLDAFCKNLQAKGVKFDQPFSKSRHKSFASAEFTDPWGVSIELTEGLSRF
jgi:catechol 2,3-dioxygenase-like lactoylglutathione lyase family enzyme